MQEKSASPARLNFSPDQLTYTGYESATSDFITCLKAEGTMAYLDNLRRDTNDRDLHESLSAIRTIFDRSYAGEQDMAQLGEAFEDGALTATYITKLHYPALVSDISERVRSTISDYAGYYGIFSDRAKDFVKAVREDGGRHYMRHSHIIFPVIEYINDTKYGSISAMTVLAEGASFVFERVRAAHQADYDSFKIDMESVKFLYPDRIQRQKLLADEVIKIIGKESA